MAGRRLKKAKEYLKQNRQDGYYEEVMKALWGYLGDKLSIPVAELSRDRSRSALNDKKIDYYSVNPNNRTIFSNLRKDINKVFDSLLTNYEIFENDSFQSKFMSNNDLHILM